MSSLYNQLLVESEERKARATNDLRKARAGPAPPTEVVETQDSKSGVDAEPTTGSKSTVPLVGTVPTETTVPSVVPVSKIGPEPLSVDQPKPTSSPEVVKTTVSRPTVPSIGTVPIEPTVPIVGTAPTETNVPNVIPTSKAGAEPLLVDQHKPTSSPAVDKTKVSTPTVPSMGTVPIEPTVPIVGTAPTETTVPTKGTVPNVAPTPEAGAEPLFVDQRRSTSSPEVAKTKVSRPTVPSMGTVPREPTVPTVGTAASVYGTLRPYYCTLAQDGHSYAEERLYNALWFSRDTVRESKEAKLLTIGWDVMAAISGMNWKTARRNCFNLVEKLVLERVESHNSLTRQGTTYRIFSYEEILERRRKAGLVWAVRNRGGVSFTAPSVGTVPIERTVPTVTTGTVPTVGRETVPIVGGGTVPTETTDTVPTEGTVNIDTKETLESQFFSSSSVISECLERLTGESHDDDAVSQIRKACQSTWPKITDAEIASLVEKKLRTRPRIKSSIVGFLAAAIPKMRRE